MHRLLQKFILPLSFRDSSRDSLRKTFRFRYNVEIPPKIFINKFLKFFKFLQILENFTKKSVISSIVSSEIPKQFLNYSETPSKQSFGRLHPELVQNFLKRFIHKLTIKIFQKILHELLKKFLLGYLLKLLHFFFRNISGIVLEFHPQVPSEIPQDIYTETSLMTQLENL